MISTFVEIYRTNSYRRSKEKEIIDWWLRLKCTNGLINVAKLYYFCIEPHFISVKWMCIHSRSRHESSCTRVEEEIILWFGALFPSQQGSVNVPVFQGPRRLSYLLIKKKAWSPWDEEEEKNINEKLRPSRRGLSSSSKLTSHACTTTDTRKMSVLLTQPCFAAAFFLSSYCTRVDKNDQLCMASLCIELKAELPQLCDHSPIGNDVALCTLHTLQAQHALCTQCSHPVHSEESGLSLLFAHSMHIAYLIPCVCYTVLCYYNRLKMWFHLKVGLCLYNQFSLPR